MHKRILLPLLCFFLVLPAGSALAGADREFKAADVFNLEWAEDPQISPSGDVIVYARRWMDIQTDHRRSTLWTVNTDGTAHRPLTPVSMDVSSPRWSPSGDRLAYVASKGGKPQLYVRWMDTGQSARISHLPSSPGNLSWSPDGKRIAFIMNVKAKDKVHVSMPDKPEGADWAEPPQYIDELIYRFDGAGYVDEGYSQVFVIPADGGTPHQVTEGDFNHQGPISWTPDGKALIFAGNRHDDWRYDPLNSEIYRLNLSDGEIRALTDREGPDASPVLSPDGKHIAYVGFDDHLQGYQVNHLYVMDADGGNGRRIDAGLDRSLQNPRWRSNGRGIYVQYDDHGRTRVASIDLDGDVNEIASGLGGESVGRPYTAGSYSVSGNDRLAFNVTDPTHPADVATWNGGKTRRLTNLNADLLDYRDLGAVEPITYESSFDGREIQGWVVKPPGFDPDQTYPMILEIHGGPFANYGPRFTSEIQLYAAAGYVILYTNPRGSTSYGEEFGNLIHHAYPGHDFDDLMSGVDALLDKGYVDKDRLYVTGGSGGGVLTAWTVGHTDRFRAAVVAKPVINWYSFVLTSDFYNFFYKYWFAGLPWNHLKNYMERSPISYAGNVTTPTMVMGGTSDYRTPASEAEQFYQALKLEKVDAALVRIPGASHHIAERPSQLIAKVQYILHWFHAHAPDAGRKSSVD